MLDEPDEGDLSDAATEARVRRSLGLGPTPRTGGNSHTSPTASHGNGTNGGGNFGQPRRRFVRDGEVPVVVLHPKSESENRHAAALADLTRQRDAERAARLRAEQALQEAQATIRTLKTRLGHTELDWDERSRDNAAAEPPPVERAFPGTMTIEPTADAAPPALEQVTDPAREAMQPTARGRRRSPASPEPGPHEEPTPVKWWRDDPDPPKSGRSRS